MLGSRPCPPLAVLLAEWRWGRRRRRFVPSPSSSRCPACWAAEMGSRPRRSVFSSPPGAGDPVISASVATYVFLLCNFWWNSWLCKGLEGSNGFFLILSAPSWAHGYAICRQTTRSSAAAPYLWPAPPLLRCHVSQRLPPKDTSGHLIHSNPWSSSVLMQSTAISFSVELSILFLLCVLMQNNVSLSQFSFIYMLYPYMLL